MSAKNVTRATEVRYPMSRHTHSLLCVLGVAEHPKDTFVPCTTMVMAQLDARLYNIDKPLPWVMRPALIMDAVQADIDIRWDPKAIRT
jgi:hypothetical protein